MNYIRHLNNFFARAMADKRLGPGHISLYMAIFQQWNSHHFKDIFVVNRKLLMTQGKIGSKNTYNKYLGELHALGYIRYYSSPIIWIQSRITVTRLDQYRDESADGQIALFSPVPDPAPGSTGTGTTPVPVSSATGTGTGTSMVPDPVHLYKQTITKEENSVLNTPTLAEVQAFFKVHQYPAVEAKKFWYYNEGKEWLLAEGILIRQWEPLAHKWMLNAYPPGNNAAGPDSNTINKDKNYDEPL